jgi:hypothetical protein
MTTFPITEMGPLMTSIWPITHAIQAAKHPRAFNRADRDTAIAVLTAWCDANPRSLLVRDRRLWIADLVAWQAKLDDAQAEVDELYRKLKIHP